MAKKQSVFTSTELDWNLSNISGIYKITNTVNNKCYIGSAKDLYKRCSEHFCHLKKNKHKNSHLQASYKKYGKVFIFEVLKIVTKEELFETEQYFIDTINPQYNINRFATGWHVKHSIASRKKISESQYKPVLQYLKDGTFVKEYPSVKSVLEEFNDGKKTGNLTEHLKGKYKQYKGFIYKYK